MSDIAINPVTRRVQFTGNTGTGPYAFTFNILVSGDIAVFKGTTELTLTTDYSVSINANGTGSITLVAALIASDVLTIIGGRELSRTTDFVTAGDLLASSLNEQLDSNVIMTQQLDEKLNRGLYVNPGDVYTDLELPLKDARKGTVLGFNATTGDPEPGPEIADVDSLAAISADIKTLAEIQDGTVATDAITNVNTIRANVTTVSGVSGNVTTVAGISGNVTSVAGNATNINTVAGIDSNVTTVAGISGNVTTVAGNTTNINSVAGNSTNINTVAGDTTEINAVAGKATEIGRLGTADAVSDLNTLGTADVVSDMNTLGTSGNVNNMGTLAGISGNITTVAGISANVTTVAGDTANISSVAGNATNINTVAGQTTNLQNVTDNLAAIQSAPANATAAAGSASAAAGSATASADSAAAAAAAFDSFDDKYLGSKTGYAGSGTGPTTDNDGNALVEGALFFSADANEMRVYDGANWIAASSAGTASLILYEFTATSGQTTFSGADDNGATLGYTTGNTQFVLNGVILDPSDVTATNGTSAVLASGAATGDLLNVYAFKSFTVADTVSASAGGTFAGNVAFGANATFGDNDKAIFGAGSDLQIYSDGTHSRIYESGSGLLIVRASNFNVNNADGTDSYITMQDGGAVTAYYDGSAKLATTSTGIDVTGGVSIDDDNNFSFGDGTAYIQGSGANDRLKFITSNSEAMRIDSSGRVGIGTAAPSNPLTVDGDNNSIRIRYSGNTNYRSDYAVASNGQTTINSYKDGDNQWQPIRLQGSVVTHWTSGSERMRIDSSGNLLVGKTSTSAAVAGVKIGGNFIEATTSGGAGLVLRRLTNDGDMAVFQNSSGSTVGSIGNSGNYMFLASQGPSSRGVKITDNFIPATTSGANNDNVMDLGGASVRWDDVYATNGSIQTSDANEKQDVAALTATEMLVAARISTGFKTFRWIDSVADKGDNARTHTGVIAQDVQAAFIAEGLDAGDYALFTSATWWETQTDVAAVDAVEAADATYDDDGNELTAAVEAVEAADAYTRTDTFDTLDEAPDGATERTRMGIRYPELLAFVGSYNEQRFASIETRLAALEAV